MCRDAAGVPEKLSGGGIERENTDQRKFYLLESKPAYILSSRVKTELRSLGTIVRVAVKSE
jgi:hypothetical protein